MSDWEAFKKGLEEKVHDWAEHARAALEHRQAMSDDLRALGGKVEALVERFVPAERFEAFKAELAAVLEQLGTSLRTELTAHVESVIAARETPSAALAGALDDAKSDLKTFLAAELASAKEALGEHVARSVGAAALASAPAVSPTAPPTDPEAPAPAAEPGLPHPLARDAFPTLA